MHLYRLQDPASSEMNATPFQMLNSTMRKPEALVKTLTLCPLRGAVTLLAGVEAVILDSQLINKKELILIIRDLKTEFEKAQDLSDKAKTLGEKLEAAEQCIELIKWLNIPTGEVTREANHFPDDRLRGVLKMIATIIAIAVLAIVALLAFPALPGLAVGAFVAAGTVGGSAALTGGAIGCVVAGVAAYKRGVSADFERLHTRMAKTAESEWRDIERVQYNTIDHILNLNADAMVIVVDKLFEDIKKPAVEKFLLACEDRAKEKRINVGDLFSRRRRTDSDDLVGEISDLSGAGKPSAEGSGTKNPSEFREKGKGPASSSGNATRV
jgi:hypothetical protein